MGFGESPQELRGTSPDESHLRFPGRRGVPRGSPVRTVRAMANVLEQLDREWQRIATSRSSTRRLGAVCALAGVASLAELERYVRTAAPEDADRILLALVERALGGEQLAARTLLQLLLPGTRNLARRWWALGDADERASAAVAAVYDRIRRYPLARRPRRIAANVLMDAASDLRRAVDPSVGGEHGE
jgi:hypothetical protein